jgi:hypothetical protein
MPEEWPPHHLMFKLLQGSDMFDDDMLTNLGTFQDQITALKTLDGWHDVQLTGLVNQGFAARISNALELLYFGVDSKKCRAAIIFFILVS